MDLEGIVAAVVEGVRGDGAPANMEERGRAPEAARQLPSPPLPGVSCLVPERPRPRTPIPRTTISPRTLLLSTMDVTNPSPDGPPQSGCRQRGGDGGVDEVEQVEAKHVNMARRKPWWTSPAPTTDTTMTRRRYMVRLRVHNHGERGG
jgi:hypothetical protein